MPGIISGQYVIDYFPAPSDNVTGLGSSIGRVWAIDAGTLQIYELNNYDGTILNQYPVVGTTTPTCLAWGDSVLYYADGTSILHAMSDDGSYIGSYDFSDSGVRSIRGLGFYIYSPILFIADDITEEAYAAYPPLVFDTVEMIADLADAPEVFYDAASWSDPTNYIYLACGNLYLNVQIYNLYGLFWTIHFSEIDMVVGMADYPEIATDEFLWLSDPEADMIYLVYFGLNIEENVTGISGSSFLTVSCNPFFNSVELIGPFDELSELLITDITGRLVEQTAFSGYYFWDGCDMEGNALPSGTYLVVLTLETGTESVKLIKLM